MRKHVGCTDFSDPPSLQHARQFTNDPLVNEIDKFRQFCLSEQPWTETGVGNIYEENFYDEVFVEDGRNNGDKMSGKLRTDLGQDGDWLDPNLLRIATSRI